MFELLKKSKATLKSDLLSGLTVALALVPEAVAFSFVAGVDPLTGLYSAFIIGLITSLLGGRPGMISGATGALAVVAVSLVANHGVEYLYFTVILMGIFQILAGLLRVGKFVRLIPHSVMLGFVNGLAIVIFLAQLAQFKFLDSATNTLRWLEKTDMIVMISLVALTMLIIQFLPKLTRAVPSSLAGILVTTGIVYFGNIETRTVIDMASVAGGLPSFHFPTAPLNLETLSIILPYSFIMASVGLIESLMTLQLIDEVTETYGRPNKECLGQGIANIITGFFAGMGGCAMIGQSMINVNSGGRGRASGISASLFLLFFIVIGSSFIEIIPLAALVGVMFMVVIGTFEWSSIRILGKIPKSDAFVIILVSAVTVFTDLAVAVFSGIIASSLVFVWKKSFAINTQTHLDEEGNKHYFIDGPLFFGSTEVFSKMFDPKNDPEIVYLDFKNSQVHDFSSLEVINNIVAKYIKHNKKVYVRNLSDECKKLIDKHAHHFSAEVLS